MSPGKLAAQAGHAFCETLIKCQLDDPDRYAQYRSDGPGTKVVLVATSLDHFKYLKHRTARRKLIHYTMVDSGHIWLPHFDGGPVETALGIGPCYSHEIDRITGKLDLA